MVVKKNILNFYIIIAEKGCFWIRGLENVVHFPKHFGLGAIELQVDLRGNTIIRGIFPLTRGFEIMGVIWKLEGISLHRDVLKVLWLHGGLQSINIIWLAARIWKALESIEFLHTDQIENRHSYSIPIRKYSTPIFSKKIMLATHIVYL